MPYFDWPEYESAIRDAAEAEAESAGVGDDEIDDYVEDAWQEAMATASAMGWILCWLHGGHEDLVEGYWPEDLVCQRCGMTDVSYNFVVWTGEAP